MSKPVPSPCVSICYLNEDDVCEGCYRTAAEITDWTRYDDEQKLAVNAAATERRRAGNPFMS